MNDWIFSTTLYTGLILAALAENLWRASMVMAFVFNIMLAAVGIEMSKKLIRDAVLTIFGYFAYTSLFGGARYMVEYRDIALLYISAAVYLAFSLPILTGAFGLVRK